MPFGRKPAPGGLVVDFDAVYHELIAPGIADAGLDPLRADQELTGGIIHKPMFERLILCEYAVADLTAANANVFYELGVRHAVRPASTLLVFANGVGQLPFDVANLRGLPYGLGPDGRPAEAAADRSAIADRLKEARQRDPDSPIYQLVDGFPDIQRLKTDVFRDRIAIERTIKDRLAAACKEGRDAVRAVEQDLAGTPGGIADLEAGVAVDLLLSYRETEGWEEMIALVPRMSPPLARSVMVREQLALALNRAGRGDEAERELERLLEEQGPSSETQGILGRVHKDRWEEAARKGDPSARGHLRKAIDAYLRGFEADWRDAFPGINAVTLMSLSDPPDPRREKLIPVVTYAVERRIEAGKPDYWDYATRLELAVLAGEEEAAKEALGDALAQVPKKWQAETTARNLRLIREAYEKRGEDRPWMKGVEEALMGYGKGSGD